MLNFLFTELRYPLDIKSYQSYLSELPTSMQLKIEAYKNWEDAQTSLLGKILLKLGLQKYYGDYNVDLADLQYDNYQRPFLPASDIDFNISHSGHVVVVSIMQGARIGVDVEKIDVIDLEVFREHFSKKEWFNIQEATDTLLKFYSYWAIKEAVVKAEGMGLTIPLSKVMINESEHSAKIFSKKWFFHSIPLGGNYCTYVASNKEITDHEISREYISFESQLFL